MEELETRFHDGVHGMIGFCVGANEVKDTKASISTGEGASSAKARVGTRGWTGWANGGDNEQCMGRCRPISGDLLGILIKKIIF